MHKQAFVVKEIQNGDPILEEIAKTRGGLAPEEAIEMVALKEVCFMTDLNGALALFDAVGEALPKAALRFFREDDDGGFRVCDLATWCRRYLCALAESPLNTIEVYVPARVCFGPRAGPSVFK